MSNEQIYSDRELMERFRSGNEDAFNVVYDRFFLRVIFFARRFVVEVEAQDIAAEAFLQLWLKREDFPHLEGMARFLFITTRNRCYNKIRMDHTRKEAAPEVALLMDEAESEHYWQDQQVRMELISLVEKQLEMLPLKTREVFLLSFNEGLKPAEIAEKLGLSVQTVKNQKVTALKLLREALGARNLTLFLVLLTGFEKNFVPA